MACVRFKSCLPHSRGFPPSSNFYFGSCQSDVNKGEEGRSVILDCGLAVYK
mgnify:CR=1 FL=1